jgi:hypothetical protein
MEPVDTRIPEAPQGSVKVVASDLDGTSTTRYVAIQAVVEIIIGVNRTSLLTQLADGRSEHLLTKGIDSDAFMYQVSKQLLPYQEFPKTQTQRETSWLDFYKYYVT